ncbi:MAG: hypothetical protein SF162_12620 [bacterium]|nr:hypothetical protein [bacterium]
MDKKRYSFAWRRARAHMGVWQPVLSIIGMIGIGLLANANDPTARIIGLSAVAGIGAMVAGVQAAFIFAPADEPALELVLSAPRPVAYLIIERLIVLAALNGAAALVGSAAFPLLAPSLARSIEVGDQLLRWFPPFVCMTGLGLALGIITKKSAFGVLLVILLVGAMLFGGPGVLTALVEWGWVAHLFLPPEAFTADQILINRALLIAIGAALIAYSIALSREGESHLSAAVNAG